jgi:hypothetical protein
MRFFLCQCLLDNISILYQQYQFFREIEKNRSKFIDFIIHKYQTLSKCFGLCHSKIQNKKVFKIFVSLQTS